MGHKKIRGKRQHYGSGYATIYTDGGCRPTNPGPAGIAAVVELKGKEYVLARPVGIKTNNQAEYMALVVGIKYAQYLGAGGLDIYCDSRLIVMQMKDLWHVTEPRLLDLRHEARALLDAHFTCDWDLTWVPRGENNKADKYCTQAILSNNPWIPNFLDPFREPGEKWNPFDRSVKVEVALPFPTEYEPYEARLQKISTVTKVNNRNSREYK